MPHARNALTPAEVQSVATAYERDPKRFLSTACVGVEALMRARAGMRVLASTRAMLLQAAEKLNTNGSSAAAEPTRAA